jgi:SAM-dependent methyltransferase
VSVGCGTGFKEMKLIEQGLVEKFMLFELSEERIRQGRELAERLGFSERVTFYNDDAFKRVEPCSVDLVHWNNSLLHMLDVDHAIAWSYDVLSRGGMFYMDDYVGPSRFQWSERSLEIASRIRKIFPADYLANPYYPEGSGMVLSNVIKRPDPNIIEKKDPSEAADSERIIDSVMKWFPNAKITFTGGIAYHLALSDILSNFNEQDEKDKALLDLCMVIDELCTYIPDLESHYAVAIAIKE